MVPFVSTFLGNRENMLVNQNQTVADERGVASIKILPQEYASE